MLATETVLSMIEDDEAILRMMENDPEYPNGFLSSVNDCSPLSKMDFWKIFAGKKNTEENMLHESH